MGKSQEVETISNGFNRICAGTTFIGNILAASDIRIDGVLEGNVTTKGKFVVGETGHIKGDIVCKNADILGKVSGKITASEFLALKSTANITGNITMEQILIEVGAKFVGYCNMANGGNGGNGGNAAKGKDVAAKDVAAKNVVLSSDANQK
ncbi:MAG: polymer-forming cytoskeletal protein [Prevotellaceae bacterium]|jgi:cytoskeletal protein CcmA (bactofilin family)|nr:polymer-forming cytoskeletal protein [Prevotellaceae bacterium]